MLRSTGIIFLCVVTTVHAESLPSPTKIRISERTKTSFKVTWEQPPSQVYERFSVKILPNAGENSDTSELSRTFMGLEPGTLYTIFVQGFTVDGFPSSVLKYEVWTVPDEPTGMHLSAVQEIAISISIMGVKTKFTVLVDGMQVEWSDDSQSKLISGYDLQVSPDEGVIVESVDDEFTGTVKRIITGLTPGKEYSVSLRSYVGPDFDPVYSPNVLGTMRMPPAVPHTLELVESEPTSVLLKTHGPIEGIHDDMFFQLKPNHGVLREPKPDPNYPMFELYPWQGLKPGTSYVLDLYAVSKNVRGYKPKTITFSTAPGPPIKLRVVDFGHYSVTLQWAHAHKFTEFDEVQYQIQFFDIPDGNVQNATVKNFKLEDTQVRVQVQKLIPGTPYEFRVYAILNGVRGTVPSSVIQTTIPLKPTLETAVYGREQGATITFGKPEEGDCPSVKVFYSPTITDTPIKPTFHNLGEEVTYDEFPTDGRYSIHARCVSQNVEGPELLITPSQPDDLVEATPDARNDEPDKPRRRLACASQIAGDKSKPDTIAPDACCNLRPYNSERKECCGDALLEKNGDRLCCGDKAYNKKNSVCCERPDEIFIRPRRDGCPSSNP